MTVTTTPKLDIIIPVWNDIPRIQHAVSAVIDSIDNQARLILIKNGSDYDTDLLIDRYSEFLGDQALIIAFERVTTSLTAYRHALTMVQAPWAMLLPTNITLNAHSYQRLLHTIHERGADAGMIGFPTNDLPLKGLPPIIESETLSCEPMAINMQIYRTIGSFNELLWDTPWAGQEYARRVNMAGYRSYLLSSALEQEPLPRHGSKERLQQRIEAAEAYMSGQWGPSHHLVLHLAPGTDTQRITRIAEAVLTAARTGTTATIFVHARERGSEAVMSLALLHQGVEIITIPRLLPTRQIKKHINRLRERPVPIILIAVGSLHLLPTECGCWESDDAFFERLVEPKEIS